MPKEWECDDFKDAVTTMEALEKLGFEYVFRSETVPCPHPLYQDQRAPRYLVTLLPDPLEALPEED